MFPKEFIIEDGHVYYRKKPLYKQPLFWTTIAGAVLSCLLGFFLLVVSIASWDDLHSYSQYQTPYQDTSYYEEQEFGKPAELLNGLKMTVTDMAIDPKLQTVDDEYAQAFVVKVQLENPSKTALYFEEGNGFVEGVEGLYYLDSLTYDTPLKKKINPGEKAEFTLIYGVEDDSNYRFIYEDMVWGAVQEEKL